MGRRVFSINGVSTLGTEVGKGKNLDPYLLPYTKNNSKWNIDLKYKR